MPEAIDFITEKSFIPEYGARPVKRAIDEYVINALSMKFLAGEIDKSKPINVTSAGDGLLFLNEAL